MPDAGARGSFAAFEAAAPELAAAARRRVGGAAGVAIGFLATVSAAGRPHLGPVCPVFCGEDLFLVAAANTPKRSDLRANGAFVLHAFLAANDEEFQLAGVAEVVEDSSRRAAVHDAIPFAAFQKSDPILRLCIERALWVYWERVGEPDTKPVRLRWP
jgi:general stress protein 26